MKHVTIRLLTGTRHVVLDERACGAADEAVRQISGFLLDEKE